MSGLIKTLCSAVDSKDSGSKVKVQDSSVGVSVQSYLQGHSKNVPVQKRQKVLDSAECLKLTCSLFSMPRTKRREFLSRVSDSVRRQLIFEGKHIRKLITDSCIAYDPELCWAIENTVNGSDETAEEILEERLNRNRLPEDVRKWYESYQKDPYGDATRRLEKLLKPFKLTRINKVKDDTNIEEYLDAGKKQESKIQGALQEEVAGASVLSEEAQAQLDEIKEGVADRTKSFIESLVEEVTEVVPTIATQNAVDHASERTEEIINEDAEKGEEEVDETDAEADEVFNDEYAEYDDKVNDSMEGPKVGSIIVVSGNTSSPKLGERGSVEKVLEKGNISARFRDGSLHVYSKDEYKVLDSVEETINKGDEVLVTSGMYKDMPGKVVQIRPELDVALVKFEDGSHFVAKVSELVKKVQDAVSIVPIGKRVVIEGDPESPRLGEVGEVIASLPTGLVSVKFDDGEVYGYGKNEYKIQDSEEIQASPVQVVVTGGVTTITTGTGISVMVDNKRFDGVVASTDGQSLSIQGLPKEFYEVAKIEPVEEYRVPQESVKFEETATEPAPEEEETVEESMTDEVWDSLESLYPEAAKIADSIERVEDAKGFPAALAKAFEKGDTIKIPYTVVESNLDKGKLGLGLGAWRLNVKVDGEIPKDSRETIEAAINQFAKKEGVSVKVAWPKSITGKGSDHFSIISKGTVKDSVELDGVEKVVEDFQVGSTVDFQNDTWKVTKAGNESITLRKTSTGEEQVVKKDCFSDVYVIQPARCIQDSEESDAVKRVVYNWLKKYSSELATNAESAPRRDAFEELAADLNVIDDKFGYSDSIECEVDYDGGLFMKDDASTLLVGGTSFVYQATDTGVEAIAEQASTAASELYDSYEPEVEETFETEETLLDALDSIRSGLPVNVVRVQDDEGQFIIMMTDLFGRDRKFVTEDGETSNKDEAKRFSDRREAFNFMKALSDAGKLSHSIFNSAPLQVTDDDNDVLSDEAKEEVLKKVEEEVVERLKEKGVDVSDRMQDSVEIPFIDRKSDEELDRIIKYYTDRLRIQPQHDQVPFWKENLEALQKEKSRRLGKVQDDGNAVLMVNKAIEEAEKETETELTPEQKESGDYKKGHVTIQDFDIAIENPKGSVRSGVDNDGKEWSQEMHNTYGYFEGTKGKDSDDVDCFLGPNPLSEDVFVIDQLDKDGNFDEHKVMFGFDSSEEAREAYLSNYEDGWTGLGDITKVNIEDFRKWVQKDDVRSKPFTEYLKVTDAMDPNEDGDERVFVNWDADKLMEYYDKVRKRKVSKEDHPSLKLKDDEELGEEKYAEFEQKLLEALKALGIDPEEGEDPQLPVPKAEVKEGRDNTYDAPHNSTTFRNLRDTEAALSKVLEIASKLAGKDKVLSVEEYKKILEDSPEDPILPIVADSTFTVGELDLICPDLYKRKFTDKFWVADSIESLGDSFNIEIPEQYKDKSALVSTSPIKANGFVVDSVLEYPYSDTHKLYVATLKDRL